MTHTGVAADTSQGPQLNRAQCSVQCGDGLWQALRLFRQRSGFNEVLLLFTLHAFQLVQDLLHGKETFAEEVLRRSILMQPPFG